MKKVKLERWKLLSYPKVDFGRYEVSSLGRVRNTKTGRILKPHQSNNGYWRVTLYCHKHNRKSISVKVSIHRLVAMHFIPNPDLRKDQVNHKLGINKRDNSIYNLEWVTGSENQKHAYDTGLSPRGEQRVNAIYPETFIHTICKMLESGYRTQDIVSKFTRMHDRGYGKMQLKALVSDIKKRRSWTFISDEYDIDTDGTTILKEIIMDLYERGIPKKEIYQIVTEEYGYYITKNYVKYTIKELKGFLD